MEHNDLIPKDLTRSDSLQLDNKVLEDLKSLNHDDIGNPKALIKLADSILDSCTKDFLKGKPLNLDNIKEALPKDKLKESFSKTVDFTLDVAKKSNLLPEFICNTLKVTKDFFMQDKFDKKIDKYLNSLEKSIHSVQKDVSNWQKSYNSGDLEGMQKALDSTKKHLSKLIPIDSLKDKYNDMIYTQKYDTAQRDLSSTDKNIAIKAMETIKLCEKLAGTIKKG